MKLLILLPILPIYLWHFGIPSWVLASPREPKPGLERNETLCTESCESAVQQIKGRALNSLPWRMLYTWWDEFHSLFSEKGARFEAEASRWHQLGLVSCNPIRNYMCWLRYAATPAVTTTTCVYFYPFSKNILSTNIKCSIRQQREISSTDHRQGSRRHNFRREIFSLLEKLGFEFDGQYCIMKGIPWYWLTGFSDRGRSDTRCPIKWVWGWGI